jgi:muramoyltetrapeptide carboxypeptidase LdcA involved in peptidoglycan recycling
MRYPSFLPKNGTIGVVAPSFGVSGFPYEDRYFNAKKKLEALGYTIKEAEHIFGIEKAASTDGRTRASEFMEMYLDDEVDFIISVAGGELMMEILPYIDFEKLRQAKPKFFMGLSDNTNLTFTLPVLTDTAAIYGNCFGSFGMEKWYRSLKENLKIITGQQSSQLSFPKYEKEGWPKENLDPYAGFNMRKKVEYKSLDGKDHRITGRLIGGCLDILVMLCGTRYGDVDFFLEKYKDDGFIWFLESYDLNILSQQRALWQLRENGWFKYCNGVIYGRPFNSEPLFDVTLHEALFAALNSIDVPVIYGCDFGHLPPGWTLISGSLATFEKEGSKGRISFELK